MSKERSSRRSSKGQSALEYLVTYGWVLIVVLVILGALAYFGLINPERWVSDKCDLGGQLDCVDFEVDGGASRINLYVRNEFGKAIYVSNATVIDENGIPRGDFTMGDQTLDAGETDTVTIQNLPSGILFSGEKQEHALRITFNRAGTGNPSHNLTGVLFTKTK